ncbi:WD40-repeat-containing domain protein [Lasiosphaeria ovina]|uniref:WD40-repeat-containing domain protein n=1 Tax=Lasiosphaeria ovina TaxID=92902 RepID=A0AAE0NNH1_9PEZI|nr:WD40-repeat-containing domain protein [Lasiosphaeria ovina]
MSAISLIEERPAERQRNVVRRHSPPPPVSSWSSQDVDFYRVPPLDIGRERPPPTPTQRPSSKGEYLARQETRGSERRPSAVSGGGYSLYPPTKPLPAIPKLPMRTTRRTSSQASFDAAAEATSPSSVRTSRTGSTLDRGSGSIGSSPLTTAAPAFPPPEIPSQIRPRPEPQHAASPIDMAAWKVLPAPKNEKAVKDPSVYWVDVSSSSATLAAKHGNNMIKVWSVGSGEVQAAIKISCYTTAQPRSREYFVRSHAILSESSTMIAIATGFGDTVEIWDWSKKKKLQTISHADRWAAVRWNVYDAGWTPLVVYRGEEDTIDLYATSNSRKPLKKLRTIELNKAGLPVLPKYPELAFSSTGPLLIAASGPRPPRLGHPPPERETILVAWQIHNDAAEAPSVPYKVVTPWQHTELDTALPNDIATYGSVAVSIWIPASYRAIPVPAARGGQGYNLAPVPVPFRYVLIWDFSASSTRTFRIPNCISCVSPDCRYVAYCDARGTNTGARGLIVLLDAMSGKQLWCWPDPDATANDSGPQPGFEQFEHLNRVIDLSFSADSGFLFVGDSEGCIGVYEVREREGQWPGVQLHAR